VHITEILAERFCSIENAAIYPSMFNAFVGQNNHGKTNIFEALNWFYTNKGEVNQLRFLRKGDGDVSVEVEFAGVQEALASMKNEKNRASIQKVIGLNWLRKIFGIRILANEEVLSISPRGYDLTHCAP
jgi:putative ATP-dependent endonuclease of the OLD family